MNVVIVDTGCANLASVGFAFDRLGVNTAITRNAKAITNAERVILPGVGAAPNAMQNLRKRKLIKTLQNLKQPVLGICLGMQILFTRSEEGNSKNLGIIKSEITNLDTQNLPSPHMGWNTLKILKSDPLLAGIKDGDYAYFVHSYAAPIDDHTITSSSHGNVFSAVVRKNNFYGCQFHPERSGMVGARILENFLKVSA